MRSKVGKPDGFLFLIVLFLTGFGLVVLYSASAYNGQVRFGDAAYYFKKQFFAMVLGLAVMYGISRVDYHGLQRIENMFIIGIVIGFLLTLKRLNNGGNQKKG